MAQSKITDEGKVAIPDEVLQALGVGPGSTLEFEIDGERVYVRPRTAADDSHEIHKKLFPDGPPEPRTDEELKQSIADYLSEKHARR